MRLERGGHVFGGLEGAWERECVEFVETPDVAEAAFWRGVTVREVCVGVLRDLLEAGDDGVLAAYVKAEGVDLADVIAVGGETAVHSAGGLVLVLGERVLNWPGLEKIREDGYY